MRLNLLKPSYISLICIPPHLDVNWCLNSHPNVNENELIYIQSKAEIEFFD